MDLGATNKPRFEASNGASTAIADYSATSSLTFTPGTWYQIVYERNYTGIYMWQNGVTVPLTASTAIGASSLINQTTPVVIGNDSYISGRDIAGNIDELNIWKGVAIPISELYPQTLEVGETIGSAPVAAFSADDTTPTIGDTVTFTDLSTNTPTNWTWDFGDFSATNRSHLQNPTHIYSTAGIYDVLLYVNNTAGEDWENKTGYITASNVSTYTEHPVWMDAAYNFTLHIVESDTALVIPDVSITDNLGNTYTTTNGTFYLTYPYSTVLFSPISATGYISRSASYIIDSDMEETIQMVKETASTSTNLNQLYPHETAFTLIDRYGNRLDNVTVTAVMMTSTIQGNWLETLFGISQGSSPALNNTIMTGLSDDYGKIAFPMISSGVYTMTFTDSRLLGGTATKRVTPDQSAVTIVLATTAGEVPLAWGDYINATLYTNDAADPTIYLNLSYNDTSLSTTSIIFFVQYPNYSYVYLANMPATPTTNQSKILGYPVQNVRGSAYVWGYYANSTFGNLSKSTGITFNGPSGGLLDIFSPHSGWE